MHVRNCVCARFIYLYNIHRPNLHFAHPISVPLTGVASFCAIVCCDSTEEACWDYADDGISLTQYCASVSSTIVMSRQGMVVSY